MGILGGAVGNEALRRVLPNATVIIHLLAMLNQRLLVVVRHHLLEYQLLGNVIIADSIRGLMIPSTWVSIIRKLYRTVESKYPSPLLKIVRIKATTTSTTSGDHTNKDLEGTYQEALL